MRMARIWAENSYCQRRKVGALLVKNKMIISDGYNGTPSGFENNCEDENNVSKPYVLHAEANAITKIARSHNSSDGATLYVTASPCMECSKLIIQAGIKLLTALVTALPTIIAAIVKAIPQIITSIINAVITAIPLIIDAGVKLLVA